MLVPERQCLPSSAEARLLHSHRRRRGPDQNGLAGLEGELAQPGSPRRLCQNLRRDPEQSRDQERGPLNRQNRVLDCRSRHQNGRGVS